MSKALTQYYEQIRQKLAQLESQPDTINRAAQMMADTVLAERICSFSVPAMPAFWPRR